MVICKVDFAVHEHAERGRSFRTVSYELARPQLKFALTFKGLAEKPDLRRKCDVDLIREPERATAWKREKSQPGYLRYLHP
jgi:hypothetical protein